MNNIVKLGLILTFSVQLKQVTFAPGETLDTAFLKQNPRRSLPALVDGDLLICDSHAINAYLVSAYGKNDVLYPKDSKDRALVDQRLYFDAGEIFPTIKQIAVSPCLLVRTHIQGVSTHGLKDCILTLARYFLLSSK
ncbi:glutathione S-transferase 1-like [Diaphorina citri]|uniref:Glutathione S-transferase 1-like n=1 Tax=Diaphorina citri TaxID=121845 RepID=A0A1S4EG70_DIACI|nr:glutathione S-transferase 1-like [Diaphorina citri]